MRGDGGGGEPAAAGEGVRERRKRKRFEWAAKPPSHIDTAENRPREDDQT
jgi:hypothetical protein